MAVASAPAEVQELITSLKRLEGEKISLINKINDLEIEAKEYKLVLDVFEKVEGTRRCCRMVGGVLVPRTVAEVRPALQASSSKITSLLTTLTEELTRVSKKHAEIASKLEPFLHSSDATRTSAEVRETPTTTPNGKGGGVLI